MRLNTRRNVVTQRYQLYINNQSVAPLTGEYFPAVDPYSGETWAEIPRAGASDVDAAVQAAHAALSGPWGKLSASDRGMMLYQLGALIEQHAEELALIEARDNGKLMSEVLGQVKYCAKYYYYFGGMADKIQGAVIPIDKPHVFNYTRYEPIGVIATITPWNSSLLLTTWKLAPALAGGNTVVCKPSEATSASLFELAKLAEKAGFPPGVINVISGFGDESGGPLIDHPLVGMVAFTGGDAGGRAVYQRAAAKLKRVTLELGGKSPNVIFDDADIGRAVNGSITGIFSACGQTCMAGSRLLVQESVHDEVVERIRAMTAEARIGDPKSPDTQIGPITTRSQWEKVVSYIDIAKSEGATCVAGGRTLSGPGYGAGQFVEPTIFTNVHNGMRIAQEEVFGPVLAVIKFKDESEAIQIANDIRFGLAASVWTTSLRRAMLMSEKLRAGTVWVNNARSTSFTTPFGGFKDSGIGREGGMEAVKEFLEVKSVWVSSDLEMPNPFVRKY